MREKRPWLTVPEVARLKGVSQQAVTKAIKDERLKAERGNGAWLIHREDAEAWEPGKP